MPDPLDPDEVPDPDDVPEPLDVSDPPDDPPDSPDDVPLVSLDAPDDAPDDPDDEPLDELDPDESERLLDADDADEPELETELEPLLLVSLLLVTLLPLDDVLDESPELGTLDSLDDDRELDSDDDDRELELVDDTDEDPLDPLELLDPLESLESDELDPLEDDSLEDPLLDELELLDELQELDDEHEQSQPASSTLIGRHSPFTSVTTAYEPEPAVRSDRRLTPRYSVSQSAAKFFGVAFVPSSTRRWNVNSVAPVFAFVAAVIGDVVQTSSVVSSGQWMRRVVCPSSG